MKRKYRRKFRYFVDSNGYKRFRSSRKLVHRFVAEKMLGRKLRPGEVVHHINRNKLDNRRSNLYVFQNQRAHRRAHLRDLFRYGRW